MVLVHDVVVVGGCGCCVYSAGAASSCYRFCCCCHVGSTGSYCCGGFLRVVIFVDDVVPHSLFYSILFSLFHIVVLLLRHVELHLQFPIFLSYVLHGVGASHSFSAMLVHRFSRESLLELMCHLSSLSLCLANKEAL